MRHPLTLFLLSLFLPGSVFCQVDKGYHVVSYDARIRIDRPTNTITGVVTMTGIPSRRLDSAVQHAKYLIIDSVIVNSIRCNVIPIDTSSGTYNVVTSPSLRADQPFVMTTFYHGLGKPEQNSYKWGGVTNSDSMMFAMGVGFAVSYTSCTRHWLPCYDLPDDKPDSVSLTFITPNGEPVASNGILVSDNHQAHDRSTTWKTLHPIATYLLTFATGPYLTQQVQTEFGKPLVAYTLRRDSIAMASQIRDRIQRAASFYDSLFAPYPFEKVGYVVTPIGSMEHQTMISLINLALDTTYTNTTPVHELAHMWWGDWVTCKTFDDAWLNEGFATYCESLILERFNGRGAYVTKQRSNISGAIAAPYPLFGAPSATNHTNNYPYSTIYQKGAAVLGMLRSYLGDSIFFSALRSYGRDHAYGVATSRDLQAAFESASGQDLTWFFIEWVFDKGTPKFSVTSVQRPNGASITFTQTKRRYFRMPYDILGVDSLGHSRRVKVWMDSTATSTAFADFGFAPTKIVVDPDSLSIKTLVSTALNVDQSPAQHYRIRIFPNPSRHGSVNITLAGDRIPRVISIAITTIGGDTAYSNTAVVLHGDSANLNLSSLAASDYFLTATFPDHQSITSKFSITP